jgi:hypothetical protein
MSSQPASQVPRPARSRAYLFLPRIGLIAMVLVVIGAVVIVAMWPSRLETCTCRPGPWGTIECKEFVFDMPDEIISREFLRRAPLKWHFPGCSWSQLMNLFRSAGLSDQDFAALLASAAQEADGRGYTVSPSETFVLNMSPQTRAKIYQVLAADPRNMRQFEPLRFPAEHKDAWFSKANLSDATLNLIKQVAYPRGHMLMVADIDVLLGRVTDPAEQLRMVKALTRTPGVWLSLHVSPGADVDELAAYWGGHGRTSEIRPLLAAIANSPTGGTIGPLFLMPNFARDRLFKYPTEADWSKHNCYWSAMNFFNQEPDDRFEDLTTTGQEIDKNYHPVGRDSARMGDLILLHVSPTSVIHACVYVADDLVFTKNGPGRNEPWLFMRLGDVIDYYTAQDPLTLTFHRLNDPSPAGGSPTHLPSTGPGH